MFLAYNDALMEMSDVICSFSQCFSTISVVDFHNMISVCLSVMISRNELTTVGERGERGQDGESAWDYVGG